VSRVYANLPEDRLQYLILTIKKKQLKMKKIIHITVCIIMSTLIFSGVSAQLSPILKQPADAAALKSFEASMLKETCYGTKCAGWKNVL
jgi:hypothetical protein